MTCNFFGSPEGALTGHTLVQIWHPIQLSITKAFGLCGMKSVIAFVGHLETQRLQTLHLVRSILERLFSTDGASKGQTFTHAPHAMHPTRQFAFVSDPLSFEWQVTSTCRDAGRTSMTFVGQAASHFLHPVHFAISIKGRWSSFMVMASKGHTLEHVPYPRHPYLHALSPPPASITALQS